MHINISGQLSAITLGDCGQNSHSRWLHFALGGPEHDKNFTGTENFSVKKAPCISNGWKEITIQECLVFVGIVKGYFFSIIMIVPS